MTSHLAINALEMVIARRGPAQVTGCVVHADRGSQFRSGPYVAPAPASAPRVHGTSGSSADNAAMDSFLALLQQNVLNARRWDTRDQQQDRLTRMFTPVEHAPVEATWGIYQRVIAAYRNPDGVRGRGHLHSVIKQLRGSALRFRNLTNYIARALLEAGGLRPRHPRL